jgi:ribosomal protein S4E
MFWKYMLNGYRIRYPDPAVKVNDTVKIDLATGKISDFIKFDTGTIAMITGGRNMVSPFGTFLVFDLGPTLSKR